MRHILDRLYQRSQLGKLGRVADARSWYSSRLSGLSDTQLREEYQRLRDACRGADFLRRHLALVLAIGEEAYRRSTGIKPYREQMLCAAGLASGFVVEMKTGEGKSVAAVLAALVLALRGHVHVVTVNDYLAGRDHDNARPVYDLLGLTSVANRRDHPSKGDLYEADVVHTSSSEVIFDYLRNEMTLPERRFPFPLDAAILDEIDFVLLDNANTQFSVGTGEGVRPSRTLFEQAAQIADLLRGRVWDRADDLGEWEEPSDVHYLFSPHARRVSFTESGWRFLQDFFHTNDVICGQFALYCALLRTLEARHFFLNGRDYIVDGGRVVLIHRENGRAMPSSRLEADLHTAIEVKEGVEVTTKPVLSNSLDYRVFFSKYSHVVGLSGTVHEAASEFEQIFRLPCLVLPTRRPSQRADSQDVFFVTMEQKHRYLVDYVARRRTNAPVLIIAGSEAEANLVHAQLSEVGVEAQLLTTQTEAEEAAIVKAAGRLGCVTVSTNMAGRGTDIVLDQAALAAGGLTVIILNRATSKRVDDQARGRAGRHGEPGRCLFFLSLEDDLFSFASPRQKRQMGKAPPPKDGTGRLPRRAARILSPVLDEVQREVQAALEAQRILNYQLSMVVEQQRLCFNRWVDEWLSGPEPEQRLCEFSRRGDVDLCLLWEGQLSDLASDRERLEAAVREKVTEFGLEVARLLLQELVHRVAMQEWMLYKSRAREIAAGLPLQRLRREQAADEYIRVSEQEFRTFLDRVQATVLGYFLTAQQDSRRERGGGPEVQAPPQETRSA